MEVSFSELKNKEIVNISDGKKLGHIIDILFDNNNGMVRGIVVPGEKRIFRKNDDLFIPLERMRRIGDDVILVRLDSTQMFGGRGYAIQSGSNNIGQKVVTSNSYPSFTNGSSYVRFRKVDSNKYK